MKKLVIILVLLFASIAMGSAYAAWTDSVSVETTVESAVVKLQITERGTQPITTSMLSYSPAGTPSYSNPYNYINESYTDLTCASYFEDYMVHYRITNNGTVDINFQGISVDSVNLTWDTSYKNPKAIKEREVLGSTRVFYRLYINGYQLDYTEDLQTLTGVTFNSSHTVLSPGEDCYLLAIYYRDYYGRYREDYLSWVNAQINGIRPVYDVAY